MLKNIKNFFEVKSKPTHTEDDFLDEDIFAILSLMIEASKIDDNIEEKEIECIKKILIEKFELTNLKAEKAINFVIKKSKEKVEIYSDIKVILDNMNHEERISVVEILWKIILADNVEDEFETNLMSRICGLLHVNGVESSIAKNKAIEK